MRLVGQPPQLQGSRIVAGCGPPNGREPAPGEVTRSRSVTWAVLAPPLGRVHERLVSTSAWRALGHRMDGLPTHRTELPAGGEFSAALGAGGKRRLRYRSRGRPRRLYRLPALQAELRALGEIRAALATKHRRLLRVFRPSTKHTEHHEKGRSCASGVHIQKYRVLACLRQGFFARFGNRGVGTVWNLFF